MIGAQELLDTIEINKSKILANINAEEVEVYKFLRNRFNTKNVAKDKVFQYLFRKFFVMDRWTSNQYNKQYFVLMERNKNAQHADTLSDICLELVNYDPAGKLHFSFATKLYHMLDPEYPIYDSLVAKVFKFYPPYTSSLEVRLDKYLTFMTHVKYCYQTIRTSDILDPLITELQQTQPDITEIGYVKLIDFIIWSINRKDG